LEDKTVKALEDKKTQLEITKEFGISQTQVSRIKSKKNEIRAE
jgi:DNA-directed RNA polymerase specialized sigma subunit